MNELAAISPPILVASLAMNAYWAIIMLGIAKVSNNLASRAMFLLPALLSFTVVILTIIELLQ